MANWNDLVPILGGQDYVAKQITFISRAEAVATEVENARNGESSLQAIINAKISYSGLASDLSAGGYRIHSLGNAVAPGDAVNLSTAQSLLSGGGTPENIAITGLNYGSLADGQYARRVGGAIVGSFVNLTELVTTGIADGLTLKVSGGAVVGYTPPTVTIGQRLFNSLLGGN